MRARDFLLALVIIGAGLLLTGYHRGAFAHAWHPHCWGDLCPDHRTVRRDDANWREVDRTSQGVPLEGAAVLAVHNPTGRTSTSVGTGRDVQVEVVRYTRRGAPDATAHAQLRHVEVTHTDESVTIAVTGPPGSERDTRIDLNITLPAGLSLRTG